MRYWIVSTVSPSRKDDAMGKMGYFTCCAFRKDNLTIFHRHPMLELSSGIDVF